MGFIDDRGRIFGRVNALDAIIVALVVLFAPVTYGAYKLFHDPPPKLTSIEPSTGVEKVTTRIVVHGEHLRPLLRFTFGGKFGVDVLVANPTMGEVVLPELQPGTYDVVLYDEGQELSRLPNAFTLARAPQPTVPLQVEGTFSDLDADAASKLTVGRAFPETGDHVAEILAARPAEPAQRRVRVGTSTVTTGDPGKLQVPAILALRCVMNGDECMVGSTVLAPGVPISLPTAGGLVPFWVADVRSASATPAFAAGRRGGSR